MIRPANAKSLGNTRDADLNAGPESVKNIRSKVENIELIIPGHGSPGGMELLERTESLVNEMRRK